MLDLWTTWLQLQSMLAWAPDWLAGILVLAAAAIAALLAHVALIATVRRTLGTGRFFLGALILRTMAATRLALVVFVLSGALQAAPFDPAVRAALGHALLIAFILLVGWFAMIAVPLRARIFLRRFPLDGAGHLLARRPV